MGEGEGGGTELGKATHTRTHHTIVAHIQHKHIHTHARTQTHTFAHSLVLCIVRSEKYVNTSTVACIWHFILDFSQGTKMHSHTCGCLRFLYRFSWIFLERETETSTIGNTYVHTRHTYAHTLTHARTEKCCIFELKSHASRTLCICKRCIFH